MFTAADNDNGEHRGISNHNMKTPLDSFYFFFSFIMKLIRCTGCSLLSTYSYEKEGRKGDDSVWKIWFMFVCGACVDGGSYIYWGGQLLFSTDLWNRWKENEMRVFQCLGTAFLLTCMVNVCEFIRTKAKRYTSRMNVEKNSAIQHWLLEQHLLQMQWMEKSNYRSCVMVNEKECYKHLFFDS